MSLRKSPQLTPALLAAARQNAQHSTGPRSPAAKQNSKLNALKHGGHVADENRSQAMLALGEDPEQFQTLTEELMSAFAGGTYVSTRVAHTSRGFCRDVCDPRYVDAITAFRPCPRSNRHSRDRTSPPRRDLGHSRGCSTGPPFTGWLCV